MDLTRPLKEVMISFALVGCSKCELCYNKFMVNKDTTSADRTTRKMRDVTEELKLGKFEKSRPLHLPEKEVKRGWQIVGAVTLMLLTVLGVYASLLMMLDWVEGDGVMAGAAIFAKTPIYWRMTGVMVLLATIECFVASVMMFAKRKVPVWLWYALVITVLAGVICVSFHKFERYEQRQCYNNYPGIIDFGYACPSVVGELSLITLFDIAVCVVASVVIGLVWHCTKSKRGKRVR